jgi:excisionase family DNA binding protein
LTGPTRLFASWDTVGTDINIVGVEGADVTNEQIRDAGGTYLRSVKQTAAYLGVSIRMLYEAVRSGDTAHVSVGSRHYISRDQINDFIEANSRQATGEPRHKRRQGVRRLDEVDRSPGSPLTHSRPFLHDGIARRSCTSGQEVARQIVRSNVGDDHHRHVWFVISVLVAICGVE